VALRLTSTLSFINIRTVLISELQPVTEISSENVHQEIPQMKQINRKSNPKQSLSSSDSAKMHALVVQQNFDGSFNLTEELCQLLGLTLEKILKGWQ